MNVVNCVIHSFTKMIHPIMSRQGLDLTSIGEQRFLHKKPNPFAPANKQIIGTGYNTYTFRYKENNGTGKEMVMMAYDDMIDNWLIQPNGQSLIHGLGQTNDEYVDFVTDHNERIAINKNVYSLVDVQVSYPTMNGNIWIRADVQKCIQEWNPMTFLAYVGRVKKFQETMLASQTESSDEED